MGRIEDRLKSLGLELPEPPLPRGSYKAAVLSGNHVYVSGQLPLADGRLLYRGKVGSDLSVEEGAEAARVAALNTLAVLDWCVGGLGRIRRIVKVTGYVASAAGFTEQARVMDGASKLYVDVLGDAGRHARVAVGVAELPLDAPVEIELVAEAAV